MSTSWIHNIHPQQIHTYSDREKDYIIVIEDPQYQKCSRLAPE